MRRNPAIEATISELEKHGADILDVSTGGKHKRVTFVYEGEQRFMTVAGTGSDVRGPDNARQAVRRQLGIRGEKKVGERREVKARAEKPRPEMPRLTAGGDGWATLRQSKLATPIITAAADRAWLAFFGWRLVESQHNPVNPRIREAMGL